MRFDPITSPVDYIILAGAKSPGMADVGGASSKRNFDVRQSYGVTGARVVYKGNALSSFSVRIRLYSVEDWAAWDVWKLLLTRPPKRHGQVVKADALDIQHPILE